MTISPDDNAAGFLDHAPDSLRYEGASRELDDTAMRLAGRISNGARILDIGCGSGSITEIIREKKNAIIVGVEPDSERASKARERGLTVISDYLSMDIIRQYEPFDYAIFADVLEHLPNPAQVVALARKALKPNGSILISVPNAAHFYSRLDLLSGVFRHEDCGIMDATHLRWFTRESIKRFVERLDFEVIYRGHTVMLALPDYANRWPFKWLNARHRGRVIRKLASWSPELFAVQHIVEARKLLS